MTLFLWFWQLGLILVKADGELFTCVLESSIVLSLKFWAVEIFQIKIIMPINYEACEGLYKTTKLKQDDGPYVATENRCIFP